MAGLSDESRPPVTPVEIAAEAQRRIASRQAPPSPALRLADSAVTWLARHLLTVLNLLAFLYLGAAILAPVLMHLGATGPAHAIYSFYRLLCHEYPQRSFFLFGDQLVYRLPDLVARVGVANLPGYPWPSAFVGNAEIGYKIALCQRDVAMYGAILLTGVLYDLFLRSRLKGLPLWAYFVFGVLPMGLDGGLQFLSYAVPSFLPAVPIRPYETLPILRALTGALFGVCTVWLAYPNVYEAMLEVRPVRHGPVPARQERD